MGNAESNVYPNPFSTSATLQINSAFKIQNAELCIYDLLGVEVKRVNHISAHEIKLNRDNLPSGVYFIQVRNNEQTITRKILISQ